MGPRWAVARLGEVLTQTTDPVPVDPSQQYPNFGIYSFGRGLFGKAPIDGQKTSAATLYRVRAGQIVYSRLFAFEGAYGVVPPEFDGWYVSNEYPTFNCDFARLSPEFLGLFLRRRHVWREIAVGSKGLGDRRQRVQPAQLLRFNVALPPPIEQRRIVARIEELASLVDAAEGIQATSRALEARLPVSAARSTIGDIHAPITALEDRLDPAREGVQTGPFGAQLSRTDFRDSGTALLTIGNVQYGGLDLSHVLFVGSDKARDLERYRIEAGDLLFARMGTVGRCCIVPVAARHALINYHIIRVALDLSRIEPKFVHWLIRASREIEDALTTNTRGATRKGVNSSIVRRLPLRVPALPEQRRIVAYLDDVQAKVDALRDLQEKTAAELDALMPSILDKAFRGEL